MKKVLFLCIFAVVIILAKNKILADGNEPFINAKACVLYDSTYDKVLFEKNINNRLPNASTTKILTAIVACENSDMSEIVEISANAARTGGSTIGLRKGNKVKMGDLMKGMLMASGNDAAVAIAEHVSGSVDEFCKLMNKKAIEIGANNTNFTSPHGLDEDTHYSTVGDLLIFSKEFMKNPYLAQIANASNDIIMIDNYSKYIKSTNEMLGIYGSVNGIKTGFTNNAGRCLITSIESGDRSLITIVMGCETKKQRTEETIKLINYGYNEFIKVDLLENMKKSFEIRIEKSDVEKYILKFNGKIETVLNKSMIGDIRYEYDFLRRIISPVKAGQELGKICIYLDDEMVEKIYVKMPENIERKSVNDYFYDILTSHTKLIEIEM